jgi:hypothetical protein
MPRRRIHKVAGVVTDGIYAGYRATGLSPINQLVEVAGGCLGGYYGGPFPDDLEPATSSWHRGPAHSFAAGTGIMYLQDKLAAWESSCRSMADQCGAVPTRPALCATGVVYVPVLPDPASQLLRNLAEVFWHFLAGFLNGFAAGYVSHLALDTGSSRSVPLLGK